MAKIFGYELKRLLLNKIMAGLGLVIIAYGYITIQGEAILGISNTAPFSPWSFGVYLGRLMPLILAAVLFFISFLYSGKARSVSILTDATGVSQSVYRLTRYGAVAAAFLLLAAAPVAYAFWLYGSMFKFTEFGNLAAPALFVLLPPFLLVMGLGSAAGRVHPAGVFALIPVALLLGAVPFNSPADITGTTFLTVYPLSLGTLDPSFQVSAGAAAFRVIYSLTGIGLTVFAGFKRNKPQG